MMAALIAGLQLCPIFMWCCTLDIGAHHACWLLLQALFITASVPTVTSTTATRTMTKGLFIVTSPPEGSLVEFSLSKNEPTVNVLLPLHRSKNQRFFLLPPESVIRCERFLRCGRGRRNRHPVPRQTTAAGSGVRA